MEDCKFLWNFDTWQWHHMQMNDMMVYVFLTKRKFLFDRLFFIVLRFWIIITQIRTLGQNCFNSYPDPIKFSINFLKNWTKISHHAPMFCFTIFLSFVTTILCGRIRQNNTEPGHVTLLVTDDVIFSWELLLLFRVLILASFSWEYLIEIPCNIIQVHTTKNTAALWG